MKADEKCHKEIRNNQGEVNYYCVLPKGHEECKSYMDLSAGSQGEMGPRCPSGYSHELVLQILEDPPKLFLNCLRCEKTIKYWDADFVGIEELEPFFAPRPVAGREEIARERDRAIDSILLKHYPNFMKKHAILRPILQETWGAAIQSHGLPAQQVDAEELAKAFGEAEHRWNRESHEGDDYRHFMAKAILSALAALREAGDQDSARAGNSEEEGVEDADSKTYQR